MLYEVENKFPVPDLAAVAQRCEALGAVWRGHGTGRPLLCAPAARFRADRRSSAPAADRRRNLVTYKGPKIDRLTKTRQELELPLADGPELAAAIRPVAAIARLPSGGGSEQASPLGAVRLAAVSSRGDTGRSGRTGLVCGTGDPSRRRGTRRSPGGAGGPGCPPGTPCRRAAQLSGDAAGGAEDKSCASRDSCSLKSWAAR